MTGSQALATADERRALDADELSLADLTRPPLLGSLSDAELTQAIQRLRDRRTRARDLANRQSREARSKAEPSGTTAAKSDAGMRSKHEYLGEALDRALAERDRRGTGSGQGDLARKAMKLKTEAEEAANPMVEDGSPLHPDDPDASHGKADLAETARNEPTSGALDHAGALPARERSRTRN